MPRTASPKSPPQSDNGNGKKRTNPLLKKPSLEMLNNIYTDPDTGKISDTYNRDFLIEKLHRFYFIHLRGISPEQWRDLTDDVYRFDVNTERREKEQEAEAVLEKVKSDPELLEALEQRILQIKQSSQVKSSSKTKEAALAK